MQYNKKKDEEINQNDGFSIIELVIVVLVLSILAVSSIIIFGSRTLFFADHQAYLLADAFKEARQRAITQQETIRVEISQDKREIRIINENEAGDETDDKVEKRILLAEEIYLTFDEPPENIANTPQEPTPVPEADFVTSNHPLSASEKVATLRFMKNGNVVNAGSNAIGDNSVVTGATFYFWKPVISSDGSISENGEVIRAITVLGSTGNTNYWKCGVKEGECTEWTR